MDINGSLRVHVEKLVPRMVSIYGASCARPESNSVTRMKVHKASSQSQRVHVARPQGDPFLWAERTETTVLRVLHVPRTCSLAVNMCHCNSRLESAHYHALHGLTVRKQIQWFLQSHTFNTTHINTLYFYCVRWNVRLILSLGHKKEFHSRWQCDAARCAKPQI